MEELIFRVRSLVVRKEPGEQGFSSRLFGTFRDLRVQDLKKCISVSLFKLVAEVLALEQRDSAIRQEGPGSPNHLMDGGIKPPDGLDQSQIERVDLALYGLGRREDVV